MHADGEHQTGDDRPCGKSPVLPAHRGECREAERRDDEAGPDEHWVGEVGDRRRGRVGVGIGDVEQPVSEAAEGLDAHRRVAHVAQGLGETEQVGTVTSLHQQHGDPPGRDSEARRPELHCGDDRSAPRHQTRPAGMHQPEERSGGDQRERGRVHCADGEHDEGECGDVAPSLPGRRSHGERDQPAEPRPGEEHHRCP